LVLASIANKFKVGSQPDSAYEERKLGTEINFQSETGK
jgi:hypothetical protein